jgi:hypothetical protein
VEDLEGEDGTVDWYVSRAIFLYIDLLTKNSPGQTTTSTASLYSPIDQMLSRLESNIHFDIYSIY